MIGSDYVEYCLAKETPNQTINHWTLNNALNLFPDKFSKVEYDIENGVFLGYTIDDHDNEFVSYIYSLELFEGCWYKFKA